MRPTFTKHPEYNYRSLLVKFAHGEPLTADELNFLHWHEKQLSSALLDPVTKYYLKIYRHESATHSFLLPHEIINKEDIKSLKKRIQLMIAEKNSHVEFSLSPEQFNKFKQISYQELILYHGNQFLTGAPYHLGGIPHVIFFQWGNLFGVAKYVVMAEEKSLKSNIMIYVEDMQERKIEECIKEYVDHHKEELQVHIQHNLLMQPSVEESNKYTYTNSPFAIPKLSLSKGSGNDKDEK